MCFPEGSASLVSMPLSEYDGSLIHWPPELGRGVPRDAPFYLTAASPSPDEMVNSLAKMITLFFFFPFVGLLIQELEVMEFPGLVFYP